MRPFPKFLSDTRGSVLMMTAGTILVLVAIAGIGIDLGRQQMVRLKLQQASDAAALAAATLPGNPTKEEQTAAAQRYFNLNFPEEYLGVKRPSVKIAVGNEVTVDPSDVEVTTLFGRMVGVNSTAAVTGSAVSNSVSSTASDYDVVMVVDESGSTGAAAPGEECSGFDPRCYMRPTVTIMDTEKTAINKMLDVIMPVGGTARTIRFGVVGYSGAISTLGGLTSNPATARSYVNQLAIRCQNYDHYGLNAGANMIAGIWSSSARVNTGYCAVQENTAVPAAVDKRPDGKTLSPTKHVIFLTDGYIMVEPPLCGRDPIPCANSYNTFLAACKRVKDTGAILHTISFVSQSPGDNSTLRSCASLDDAGKPRYYYAPDAATLQSILKNVGATIRKTRITR